MADKPQPKQQSLNWLESLLMPLFDRIGLNGAAGVQRTTTQPTQGRPILSDDTLRGMGYSEEDIRAVRAMERSNIQR